MNTSPRSVQTSRNRSMASGLGFVFGKLLVMVLILSTCVALRAQGTAALEGTIEDPHQAPLPGLTVTLVPQNDAPGRSATSKSDGGFAFSDLGPGSYVLKIESPAIEPYTSAPISLAAGERRTVPVVVNRIATKFTSVDVHANLTDIAQAQVQQLEQQRILGFLPNYYTSYIWNAAPMTQKMKFKLGLRTATDPVTFVVVGGVAGVEQWHKTFPGYHQEFEGYARRYGATYADTLSGRMLGSAIFPAIFHQDPRYFYRGSGSVRSRLTYAILSTFICRADDGHLEPNYSHVLGSFTAAGLSNLYRSPQDRQAGLTLRNGLIITASGAFVNVMREFLSRQLTSNVPSFAKGKP